MNRFICLLLMLVTLALPAQAATSEDLAKIQDKLTAKQQEQQNLQAQASKTEGELKALREKLVAATREEKDSQERLLNLQSRLDELQKQEQEEQKALGDQQSKLSGILAAMLRLSRMPPEVLMLQREAPIDNLRSAILLRQAMPYYAEKAQDLSAHLEKLQQTRQAILEKRKDLLEAQQSFSSRDEKLNALLGERQTWLKASESQRADIRKQIEGLSAEAKNVQDLLSRVTSPSVLKLGKKLKTGPIAFSLPVKGRLIYGFGDADDVGSESRGMMLSARAGDIIVAPADGQVVFAGPFKGYGNILILRHNDDYHSFLAGFGRVDAAVGQVVNAGEPLGKAPLEKGGSAQVYYELRYRGTPVDPLRRMSSTALAANRSNPSP